MVFRYKGDKLRWYWPGSFKRWSACQDEWVEAPLGYVAPGPARAVLQYAARFTGEAIRVGLIVGTVVGATSLT